MEHRHTGTSARGTSGRQNAESGGKRSMHVIACKTGRVSGWRGGRGQARWQSGLTDLHDHTQAPKGPTAKELLQTHAAAEPRVVGRPPAVSAPDWKRVAECLLSARLAGWILGVPISSAGTIPGGTPAAKFLFGRQHGGRGK